MITQTALYEFLLAAQMAAPRGTLLKNAELLNSLRRPITDLVAVIRIKCFSGRLEPTSEPHLREMDVDAVIECFYEAATQDDADSIEEASEFSFELMSQVCAALAGDPTLGGQVCVSQFNDFDIDRANLNNTVYGATYLYGKINP